MNMMRMGNLTALAAAAGLWASASHAEEIPVPELEFVFEETVLLADKITVGKTPYGERFISPIIGGPVSGKITGEIVPDGWDWQLLRDDGCFTLEADYMIRTDDGVIINVLNEATRCLPTDGSPPGLTYTHPKLEAPMGKYDWINKATFISAVDSIRIDDKPAVHIRFYRIKQ